jgi:hypothetical protein
MAKMATSLAIEGRECDFQSPWSLASYVFGFKSSIAWLWRGPRKSAVTAVPASDRGTTTACSQDWGLKRDFPYLWRVVPSGDESLV